MFGRHPKKAHMMEPVTSIPATDFRTARLWRGASLWRRAHACYQNPKNRVRLGHVLGLYQCRNVPAMSRFDLMFNKIKWLLVPPTGIEPVKA